MLDLNKVREDPETLTGLTKSRFDRVRSRFSGTDSQFLTVAILCHLNSTHRVLAKLMNRLQPAITRDVTTAREDFARAYQKAMGSPPRMPINRINSVDDLIKRHPRIADFFLSDPLVAA